MSKPRSWLAFNFVADFAIFTAKSWGLAAIFVAGGGLVHGMLLHCRRYLQITYKSSYM